MHLTQVITPSRSGVSSMKVLMSIKGTQQSGCVELFKLNIERNYGELIFREIKLF